MKDKKDIFDLFRNNEHKLDERPDDKLWDRLEGRLDQSSSPRLRTQGNRWRRWMSMAGVVLALVVLISAINLLFQDEHKYDAHAVTDNVMPVELEEIGVYSDKNSYTASEYQKILARLNTSPILEGDPTKELRIQKRVFASMNERSKKYIASVNKVLESEKESFKKSADKIDQKIAANDHASSHDEGGIQTQAPAATNMPPPPVAYNDEVVDLQSADGAEVTSATIVQQEAKENGDYNNYDMADMAEVEEDSEALVAEEYDVRQTEVLNAKSNMISAGADVDQIGLQQFEWLLGKWEAPATDMQYANNDVGYAANEKAKETHSKSESNKMAQKDMNVTNQSVEEWKALNEFTIAGQGYLVVNGDTTFTENMKIQKIDNDLYYILALDNSGQTVQYKLKTYTAEGAVFENNNVAFPNQVILQQNVQGSNFTTLLQNSAPATINNKQQQYLQNRNMINSEQVKRVMNRVEE